MKELGITPGPWLVDEDSDELFGCAFYPVETSDGVRVCEVAGDSENPSELTSFDLANARLIAAGPELYEALCNLLRATTVDALGMASSDHDLENAYVDARAALARARGESQG